MMIMMVIEKDSSGFETFSRDETFLQNAAEFAGEKFCLLVLGVWVSRATVEGYFRKVT